MREIKFRAWDAVAREMVSDPSVPYDWKLNDVFTDHTDYIFMQFTGMRDKNGKEIYEGDIVRERGGEPKVVEWQAEPECWTAFNYFDNPEDFNVIGNKFENPEILKGV